MRYFSNLLVFDKVLYIFGQVHHPSSGVSRHCIHAIGICHAEILKVGKITSVYTCTVWLNCKTCCR